MSKVRNISVEILAGNCGDATEDEIDAYARLVRERLCELYPGANVETEIVSAGGSGRNPRVDGSTVSEDADTVARVVQDVWEEGAFWSDDSAVPTAQIASVEPSWIGASNPLGARG